ncbi:MAG: hypothetical protein ABI306_04605, partial [Caulobacteraceae bacterium]
MIEHAILTWLINALWLIPLVACAAALAARFGRLGPRGRHAAWVAALGLAVTLPALPAAFSTLPLVLATHTPDGPPTTAAQSMAPFAPASASFSSAARPAGPWPRLVFDGAWTRASLLLGGIVAAIALGRLLAAAWAGRALAHAGRPISLDSALARMLTQLAARHGRKLPPVLESTAISGPAVVGAFRPVILTPPGFTCLPLD